LRAASIIVPHAQRGEWLQEWRSEVWHWAHFLVESDRLSVRTEQELLGHCLGAFSDALWCRFNRVAVLGFLRSYPISPSFCLMTILTVLLAFLAASPPSLWRSSRSGTNDSSLLTVSLDEKSHWLEPELLRDAAIDWSRDNALIADAETYAWRPSVIRGPAGKQDVLSARVMPGLFQLLRVKPVLGRAFDGGAECADCIVLSNAVCREQFHGDTRIIGEFLSLNGQRVRVLGVLPEQFRFPGINVGLYTPFEAEPRPRLPGFEWPGVVLRVANGFSAEAAKRQIQSQVNETSFPSSVMLEVLSLKDIRYRSIASYLALTVLAMVVPFTANWRSVGRLCTTSRHRTSSDLLRWWAFFAVKTGMLIVIVWLASMDLVEAAVQRFGSHALEYASGGAMWGVVVGLTIALSWSIRDQGARCRTCLKRLHTQIALGVSIVPLWEPSGLDLLCDSAHGMLHVPVMQLSCLDSERWIDFDESWREVSQNA
jgi:hypothetical protein